MTGVHGLTSHFVPLAGATASGDDISMPVTKSQGQDAPNLEADGQLPSRRNSGDCPVTYRLSHIGSAQVRPAEATSADRIRGFCLDLSGFISCRRGNSNRKCRQRRNDGQRD
jgi:hypothetical protein